MGNINQEMKFEQIPLEIKTLENFKGELPKYETVWASGLDVRAQIESDVCVEPLRRIVVPTGLALAVPAGFEIQVRPRSGWAFKKGMTVLNTPGTIDADYRGEIKIILVNLGSETIEIKDQDRIAQLVLCPVVQAVFKHVDTLSETARGEGGFGSTGN